MTEGTYRSNGIPWSGPSMVVPAQAVAEMRKFNQMWTAIPLEECQRTCHMKRRPGTIDGSIGYLTCSFCYCGFDYTEEPFHCMNCGAKVIDE